MAIKVHSVIGLMSGTSLDGLDIAFCRFEKVRSRWKYQIIHAETIPYSGEWQTRLATLPKQSAAFLAQTDADLGHFMGTLTHEFMQKYNITPDFIASHGHTVFHQPGSRLTTQIGKGAAIAAESGIPVICDFRSTDVALGGQGAPLVPIGDKLLFSEFDYCLNLGGFANISFDQDGKRIAFDICPVNIVLNKLAALTGRPYDPDGILARSGRLIPLLLEKLNKLPFYHDPAPKSLGKEWVDQYITPLLEPFLSKPSAFVNDLMHTFCEHIAMQVQRNTGTNRVNKLLITGGGALNQYLVERIRHHAAVQVILPDIQTIQFKEALIFAFLGLLRWRNEVNCLASVTGSKSDHPGGAIYL
ncbi:MAG: anhydro-N-acetylmuramic acid kinase [bacterium]